MAFRNLSITLLGGNIYQLNFECDLIGSEIITEFGADTNYGFVSDQGDNLGPTSGNFFNYQTIIDTTPLTTPQSFHYNDIIAGRAGSDSSGDQEYTAAPPPPLPQTLPIGRSAPNWQLSQDFHQEEIQIASQKNKRYNSKGDFEIK